MIIAIFQSKLNGLWAYAPIAAVEMFEYDAGEFETREAAIVAARADRAIPKGAQIAIPRE